MQHEVDALKERVEEVTLDLEILQGEIDKSGGQTMNSNCMQLSQR